jgi:hypothetical protein
MMSLARNCMAKFLIQSTSLSEAAVPAWPQPKDGEQAAQDKQSQNRRLGHRLQRHIIQTAQSRRDCASKPRVARKELRWVNDPRQPQGGCGSSLIRLAKNLRPVSKSTLSFSSNLCSQIVNQEAASNHQDDEDQADCCRRLCTWRLKRHWPIRGPLPPIFFLNNTSP